ncbi:MAG TPA: hypothetical protein DCR07_05330 [Lactococcus sp.]|nr:hypothetical protein [Lactococcus sp.]
MNQLKLRDKNRRINILLFLKVSIITIIIITIIIIFSGCAEKNSLSDVYSDVSDTQSRSILEMELVAYSYAVSTFDEVTVEEVENKIERNDKFLLYVGRETCEWCRKIAPVLSQVSQKKDIDIYYLDSADTESDLTLKTFREVYGIETVPVVIDFSSNGKYHFLEYDLMKSRKDLVDTLSKLIQ